MPNINGIDYVETGKIKVVRITYTTRILSPIHVADKFELTRRTCLIEPFETFLEDSSMANFKNLDVGDIMNIEIEEMLQEEFNKLPQFRLPVL